MIISRDDKCQFYVFKQSFQSILAVIKTGFQWNSSEMRERSLDLLRIFFAMFVLSVIYVSRGSFRRKLSEERVFFGFEQIFCGLQKKISSTFVNFASQLPRGTFWPKTFQKQKKYIFNIFLGFEWKCFGIDKKFQHVVKKASYLSGQKCWWNFFPKNMFPWKISDFEEKTVSYWWLKSSTALSKVPFTNTVEVFQTKTFLQKV